MEMEEFVDKGRKLLASIKLAVAEEDGEVAAKLLSDYNEFLKLVSEGKYDAAREVYKNSSSK